QLEPFLEQLNPILQYLEINQWMTADFISNGAGALADTVETTTDQQRGHYLRQWGPTGEETAAFWPTRPSVDRGNTYLPAVWQGPEYAKRMIFPEADCANVAGANGPNNTRQVAPAPNAQSSSPDDNNHAPGGSDPSCWTAPAKPAPPGSTPGEYPHVNPAAYGGK
ncbi:MAG: hypothetical protein JWM71_456, partial [Solirubrobacteraceae bacterium]|nr:hypothetical protein [Solirubrobacteraceae bacterium]